MAVLSNVRMILATLSIAAIVSEPSLAQQGKSTVNAQQTSRPGWLVDVMPSRDQSLDITQDYLAQIIVPPAEISLESHRKDLQTDNSVLYRGRAFLEIRESGRRVFFMRADTNYSCNVALEIDGRIIIEPQPVRQGKLLFGGVDMEKGRYRVQFLGACYLNKGKIIIQTRGPSESTPRNLRADEIFVRSN